METPPTGLRGEEPDGDDWGSFFEGLEVEENKSSSSSDFGDPNKFGFWDVSDLECLKKKWGFYYLYMNQCYWWERASPIPPFKING